MKSNKIHSFVILAYKESKYLEACIKSCLAQEKTSEVIIATTTDNDFIRKLAEKYNIPVKVGKHTNIGGDFDFAINAAETKLVTVAHQDDIYEKNYAEKIIAAYKKHKNSQMIFSDYYEIRNEEKVETNINLKIKRVLLTPALLKKELKSKFGRRWILRFGNAICCPAVTFVKTEEKMQIFSSDYKCNVDWAAWEKMSLEAGSFVFVPERLMGHRISESSTTTEIISQGIRTKEDMEIFRRFWPEGIAKAFTKFYQKSEKSNQLSR